MLLRLNHTINNYIYLQFSWPKKSALTHLRSLRDSPGDFASTIDFAELENRLSGYRASSADDLIEPGNLFPELVKCVDDAKSLLQDTPPSRDKAEAWVEAQSALIDLDLSIEIAVYMASRGRDLPVAEIAGRFQDAIAWRLGPRTKNRGTMSLSSLAETLAENPREFRFFQFRDDDQDFIDGSFVRSVEWLKLSEFEPWAREALAELREGVNGDFVHRHRMLWLFHWCRSDIALQNVGLDSWGSWFLAMTRSDRESGRPWVVFDSSRNHRTYRPSVEVAAVIVLMASRLGGQFQSKQVVIDARQLLLQSQLADGSWPEFVGDVDSCIVATCIVTHALALSKSPGWERKASLASKWILAQQRFNGCWSLKGEQPIWTTVLALDAIDLANGVRDVTFSADRVHPDAVSQFGIYPDDLKADVLLVTVNAHETRCLLEEFQEAIGKEAYSVNRSGRVYNVIGVLNGVRYVHTITEMGSGSTGASLPAVRDALAQTRARAVVAVGLAFGVSKKTKIGTVLVSTRLALYEPQRVGSKTVYRGPGPNASSQLLNFFRNYDQVKRSAEVQFGCLLSGEKLIDKQSFRDELVAAVPDAIGGEMEGSGIYVACENAGVKWIIIKAVCDYADGFKSSKKEERQLLAAKESARFVVEAFSHTSLLGSL